MPWRNDRTPSLGVSLTTGLWRDWGRPGDGGTVLDLVMRLDNCDLFSGRDILAGILGISDVPGDWRPRERPMPKCGDCRHVWKRYPTEWGCLMTPDPLTEEPMPTVRARRQGWPCGPYGQLFEARPEVAA